MQQLVELDSSPIGNGEKTIYEYTSIATKGINRVTVTVLSIPIFNVCNNYFIGKKENEKLAGLRIAFDINSEL